MRGKLQYILRFPPKKSGGKDEYMYILIFPGENEYILIFPGEKLVYTHFSGGDK
jgi:hypothetical protein